MENIVIYVATIEHKYGVNRYAAKSPEGLMKELYEYVKEYWNEEMPEEELLTEYEEEEAIEAYFETANGETITYLDPIPLSEIPD